MDKSALQVQPPASLLPETPYGFESLVDEVIAAKLCEGMSVASIARTLNLTYGKVYIRVNNPQFRLALQKYKDDVFASSAAIRARLEMAASLSLDKLIGILESSPNEEVVKSTAFGILDRAGHSVKQQATITHIVQIEPEQARTLETTFREVNPSLPQAQTQND